MPHKRAPTLETLVKKLSLRPLYEDTVLLEMSPFSL
jgi:hypothetical protein